MITSCPFLNAVQRVCIHVKTTAIFYHKLVVRTLHQEERQDMHDYFIYIIKRILTTKKMESPVARRFERMEPKMGFELKTIVLTSVCFCYTIAIFLTAAFVSKAAASAMSSVSASLKRYQFWTYESHTKLDMKPISTRSTKHIYQG